jgi:hypothetical protein
MPTTVTIGSLLTTPDGILSVVAPPLPAPLTMGGQVETVAEGETRYTVDMNGPGSGQSGAVFILTVLANPSHLSLQDWFNQNIDPDNLLAQSQTFTSITTSSRLNALVLTGGVPPAFIMNNGPVSDAYVESAAGDRILIFATSQDSELSQWNYTPEQIHNLLLTTIDTVHF